MTGEVTRRSIQTPKQEKQPKFGALIKAGRPREAVIFDTTTEGQKTSRGTRFTPGVEMHRLGQRRRGQGGTGAVSADVGSIKDEGVVFLAC